MSLVDISAEPVISFHFQFSGSFWCPSKLTTARRYQFEVLLFCEISRLLGAYRFHTSYHPSSNRMIARIPRQLKATLSAILDQQRWTKFLPIVLPGCHSDVKTNLSFSSAEHLYGTTLMLLGTSDSYPTLYINSLCAYSSSFLPMSLWCY